MKYLKTGSSLLNLVCSGQINGGIPVGAITSVVGDSSSGKTFLALTMLATACYDKEFSKYKLIYDDVERACAFNMDKLFGEDFKKRIVPPKENGEMTDCIEDFYFNLDSLIGSGEPFIYVLDSMDSLKSLVEYDKFQMNKESFEKGNKLKGAMTDGKAAQNSQGLRRSVSGLAKTQSALILVSQVRDDMNNANPMFASKIRSGGRALRFYSSIEMWLAYTGKIKKKVNGIDRNIGINTKVTFKKNKVTGKTEEVTMPIYYQYGIDDTGSCVDFLIKEGGIVKSGNKLSVTLGKQTILNTRDKMIVEIEEKGLLSELRKKTEDVWFSIEKECSVERKAKF